MTTRNDPQDLKLQLRVRQALDTLWMRRWVAVAVAWLVAVLAVPVVLLTPNRYEATAQIHVDTQKVLKPLMQGLAYTPDVDQQVRMLARTLISRPNVEQLVGRADLGLALGDSADPLARERAIERFTKQMRVVGVPASTNLYSITYRDTDASRAERVVQATLELFVDAGSESKRRDSAEASRFIDEQIKIYESKLVEAENRLKDFKLKNFGVSGAPEQDFFARMSVLSEEVAKLRVDLAAAEQSRDAFKRELAGENPQLPADATPTVPVPPTEIEVRLETQKRLLDDMLRKYTEQHPDVIATRRLVQQLEVEKRREAAEKAAALAGRKGLAATSPVYQQLRVSLAAAEAQVASLRSQLGLKEGRLEQLRKVAGRAPQIEADLAQLNRDYDVINKNYRELVTRRESASLGVKLDEESRLADFRVVEPPRVAPSAVPPSRFHIALAAALLALAAGIGVPLLMDVVRPTIKDIVELQRATGRQVLGAISMAVTAERRQYIREQGIGVAMACGGLMVIQAGWLLWLSGILSG